MNQYKSTKLFEGYSVAFRQWRAIHSHDAISVVTAPQSKFSTDISHELWSSLIHTS